MLTHVRRLLAGAIDRTGDGREICPSCGKPIDPVSYLCGCNDR